MGELKTIRVYELDPEEQGERILVDRLWPRGVRKEALMPFQWVKEIAPSAELRKWFCHDPERFEEFRRKYREELEASAYAAELLEEIRQLLPERDVLLMYGARDREHNQAMVLREWLLEKLAQED